MEIRSVKRYCSPAYPDKPAALVDPYILRVPPERWKRNAAACAALAATSAMLLSSCNMSGDIAAHGPSSPSPSLVGSPSPEPVPTVAPTPTVLSGIPLFEHGYGIGAFGCIIVNPPAYLTEAEAMAVIMEAAKAEGLDLSGSYTIRDAAIPLLDPNEHKPGRQHAVTYGMESLVLDGYDSDKRIGVEFVSREDAEAMSRKNGFSAGAYYIKEVAVALNDSLNDTPKPVTVAVFYDPVAKTSYVEDRSRFAAEKRAALERAHEDLRAQVVDFLEWLKAQGII